MAIYSYSNGELKPLDSSDRVWAGTKAAWEALGDEQPKNCLVAFTDDYGDTVASGTGTRNATYVSASSFVAKWHKLGRVCMVEIQLNTSVAVNSDKELIFDFPKPLENVALVAQGSANETVGGLVLKTNGAVRTHYNCGADKFFHVTATYITAE